VTQLPPDGTSASGPVTPEVLGDPNAEMAEGAEGAEGTEGEQITSPTRLIRIASMVRALLDEARRAPLDDAGRRSLREIHERSIHGLEDILSDDLKQELEEVTLPFTSETPTESELRIAQAQLVGWLEGLFHGIQATLFTQQVAAQRQLEDMRGRRAIEMGGPGGGGVPGAPQRPPGAYL